MLSDPWMKVAVGLQSRLHFSLTFKEELAFILGGYASYFTVSVKTQALLMLAVYSEILFPIKAGLS